MSKSIILNLGHGDLNRGFPRVTAQLWATGHSYPEQFIGSLPAIPELEGLFRDWQKIYLCLCSPSIRLSPSRETELENELEIEEGGITNISVINFDELSQNLEQSINNWFQSQEFLNIDQQLRASLDVNEEIRVIIEINEVSLRRLPWHCWDFFRVYPKAEMALSRPEFKRQSRLQPIVTKQKVRILAILGNSVGIDLQTEARLLQSIHDAEVVFLVNPEREEFNKELLNSNGWDILFFAGHSQTEGETGRIYINENKTENSLTIEELETALKGAIARGLQLAIFNSCDGLGLGLALEKLNIPTVIVMREPIPNFVAQEFFHHFLHAFAVEGLALYLAVQQARKKLVDLELDFPAASWLPVICQNPAVQPPTWLTLGGIPPCPYRGLFAFHEEDAHLFFGREKFTSQLVKAVNSKKLVAVMAPSGSGKSSVVFAGLIPYLRSHATGELPVKIATFRPGNNPFDALATALHGLEVYRELSELFNAQTQNAQSKSPSFLCNFIENIVQQGQRLVLVADQFEELYTLIPEASRLLFLQELLKAVNDLPNFTLIITLRADFLGRALEDECLGKVLQQYPPELLIPMDKEELQSAIVKPAQMLGVKLEEGLTEDIINDVNHQPGHLSLLQFALTQLWSTQREGILSRAAYQEIGGVEKALAKHAEQVYLKLSPAERKGAKQIFTQLVQPGEGTEDTRRLATRAEVGEDNWNLVAYLASARLVVTGRDEKTSTEIVEIVHEELIRGWKELKIWMQQDREFRSWQQQLRGTIRTWENSGKDEGALLQGKTLTDAEDWQFKRFEELSFIERDFIKLSLELRNRQNQKEKRQVTLLRSLLGLVSVALVGTFVGGTVAVNQWQRAEKVQEGQINALSGYSNLLSNYHQEFDALIEQIRAGQQVGKQKVSNQTRSRVTEGLRRAIYQVKERNRLVGHQSWVYSAAFSPDGKILATASEDKTVKIWSLGGQLLRTLVRFDGRATKVVFSPDGKILATASGDRYSREHNVKLWSLDGKLIGILEGHTNGIWGVSFSPDGKMIATSSDDETVKLWTIEGKLLHTFTEHSRSESKDVRWVRGVSFSPDGKMLVTSSRDKTIKLWDINSHQLIRTFTGHQNWVDSVNFSPDGKIIASASHDKTIKLWSIDGKLLHTLTGHEDGVKNVVFSPDGKTLASASGDKTIKLWSTEGQLLESIAGHQDWVDGVAFSPDGKTLASTSQDNTIKLWHVDLPKLRTLKGHKNVIELVRFSPNGQMIATRCEGGTAKLWSIDGQLLQIFKGKGDDKINDIYFSPDSQTIITFSKASQSIRFWNIKGELLRTWKEPQITRGITISPDGKMIAAASENNTITLWNINGQLLHTLPGHRDSIMSINFSPDGQSLVSGSIDRTVKLWSIKGQLLQDLRGHQGWVRSVVFSPDGKTIASGSDDKIIKLWSVDGRLLQTLRGHNDEVRSVSFSPDGKIIASSSADKTIKLWSLDGQLIETLIGHKDSVQSVSFSPDGKTLASGSRDKTVILRQIDLSRWSRLSKLELNPLLAEGCNWLHDYLKTNPNIKNERHLCRGITSIE
ncbi:MAG: CHAT domain-containing protein [Scytonematopsis contorta HA4267-MV1]|jgi:WD40 repeat protein|nr:CHAT domain-containing protein [Scytonematopsis contorta HA4267-MV1]